jgi:hypothetical protein
VTTPLPSPSQSPTGSLPTPEGGQALAQVGNTNASLLVPFPYIPQQAPSSYASGEFNSPLRGICSLSFLGRTWRFRTNPNSIRWGYTLNTHVDETYGGRVVQLLSTKIEDLVVKVECGNGGWAYNIGLVLFLRDLLVSQRDPLGVPAVFEYTTRNWKFNVYALTIPFGDRRDATVRELELHFKVQEDVTGVVSGAILSATLATLQEGIGWTRNKYNAGSMYAGTKEGNTNPESGPVGTNEVGAAFSGQGVAGDLAQIGSQINVSNISAMLINAAPSWASTAGGGVAGT